MAQFNQRFAIPEPPDALDDDVGEVEGGYPHGRDHVGMAMNGAAALAMARLGLQSFKGTGDLYGAVGQIGENPLGAVKNFIDAARKTIDKADTGAGGVTESVLMQTASEGGDQDLNRSVRKVATRKTAERKRLTKMSRALASREIEVGLEKYKGSGTPDDVDPSSYTVADAAPTTTSTTKAVAPGEAAMKAMKALEEPRAEPYTSEEWSMDAEKDATTPGAGERARKRNRELARRTGMETGTTREVDESRLRAAYEEYKSRNQFERVPDGEPTLEELKTRTYDPGFQAILRQQERGGPTGGRAKGLQDFNPTDPSSTIPRSQFEFRDPLQDGPPGTPGSYENIRGNLDELTVGSFMGENLDMDDLLHHDRTGMGRGDPGLVDDLADRARRKFEWMKQQLSDFDYNMQKTHVDEFHQQYEIEISYGGKTATHKTPLVSEFGTYRPDGQSQSFTTGFQRMFDEDFFSDSTVMDTVRQHRGGHLLARPEERTMLAIGSFAQKMQNDLKDKGDPEMLTQMMGRMQEDYFEKKAPATSSMPETLNKAMQVRNPAQGLYEEVRDSASKRQHLERGVESFHRMQRMQSQGNRYLSTDTEFVSPDQMRGWGVTSDAKMAYEISGMVMSAEDNQPDAGIYYRPNLEDMARRAGEGEAYAKKMREGIKNFQMSHTGKAEEQAERYVQKMENGGVLRVSVGGESYDITDPNADTPDFIDPRKQDESLERYYTRVQKSLLEHEQYGADFMVGQNATESEIPIFKNLFQRSGIDRPSAMTEGSVVDLMETVHASNHNEGFGRSLGNITSSLYDMSQLELSGAQKELRDEVMKPLEASARAGRSSDMPSEEAMLTAKSRLNRKIGGNLEPGQQEFSRKVREGNTGGMSLDTVDPKSDLLVGFDKSPRGSGPSRLSSGQRQFLGDIRSSLDLLTQVGGAQGAQFHTATFDALSTGAFAMRMMGDKAATERFKSTIRRSERVLQRTQDFAGDRKFTQEEGAMDYAGMGEDEGALPFFANPEGASMGMGSLMHSRALPFARLQNPVRQPYQRIKPKKLASVSAQPSERANVGGGKKLPLRGQAPTQSMRETLDAQTNMQFYSAEEGKVASYQGSGMFPGLGTATPKGRMARGGHPAQERQFSVTTRMSQIPRDTRLSWGSQLTETAAHKQALVSADVRSQTMELDSQQIGDMEEWVKKKGKEMGIESPLNDRAADRQRKALEELYILNQVRGDEKAGTGDSMQRTLDAAIEDRRNALEGNADKVDTSKNSRVQDALETLQKHAVGEDQKAPVIGKGQDMFNPQTGSLVTESMRGPENPQAMAVDAKVKFKEGSRMELQIDWVEDPGDVNKVIANATKAAGGGSVIGNAVSASGDQATMEAAFQSQKRQDFSGWARNHAERFYRQAVDEIQFALQEAQSGNASMNDFIHRRRNAVDNLANSLSEMTGGEMSADEIKSTVINDGQNADFLEINYTDQFSRQVEENLTLGKVQSASQKSGLTAGSRMELGAAGMMSGRNSSITESAAKKKLAGVKKDQLGTMIDQLEERISDKKGEMDHAQKEEAERSLRQLKKHHEAYSDLLNGNTKKFQEIRDQGAIFDFHVSTVTRSEKGPQVMTGFQTLTPEERVQNPPTGGSTTGDDFESGVGRPTKRKRSSVLTTAIMTHSARTGWNDGRRTSGGRGGDLFAAALGARSGAGQFSQQKLNKEISREMQKNGNMLADLQDRITQKEGDAPTRKKLINDGLEFNQEERRFEFVHDRLGEVRQVEETDDEGRGRLPLDVNPYVATTTHARHRVAVASMISGKIRTEQVLGMEIGGSYDTTDGTRSRALKLVRSDEDSIRAKDQKLTTSDLQDDRITASEMQHHYGRGARKKQHEQFKEGRSSTEVQPSRQEMEKHDSRKMYFGPDERIGDSPIFSEKYDFMQVEMHSNLDDNQLKKLSTLMKKSGMSNDQVGRALFGGEHFIKKALGASMGEEDPVSQRRMDEVVEHLRSESEGFGRQVVLPTRTGKARPTTKMVGGGKEVSIGNFAHLTDRLDAIQTVEGAVERIHRFAEELDPENRQDLQRLKRKAESELQNQEVSNAFREVSQMFGAVLRQNVDRMAGHMGEVAGRYMGGEYKVAMPQTRIMPKMRELHSAANLGGDGSPGKQFRNKVRQMMENAKPHAVGTDGFDQAVKSASEDLFSYVNQQHVRHGGEVSKWQGMGVSEGFIKRSEAQKTLDEMETAHKAGTEDIDQIIGEPTSAQGRAQGRLRDLEQSEIARVRQEINRPGSTSGILGIMTRQPDFQAVSGYETGRQTAMGRHAMTAMGMDPDQISTISNPLASFSRGEDFDMDLNYRAMLQDPAIASQMREQAQHGSDQLLQLHRILEQVDPNAGPNAISREGPSTQFRKESTEEIYMDLGNGGRQRIKSIGQGGGGGSSVVQGPRRTGIGRTQVNRITTNVESGTETFDEPIGSRFGYSGSALEAQLKGAEAREAYSLQQSVVGSFGAYAKQGAVQTRQQVNAFSDVITRMEKQLQQDEMLEAHRRPSATATAEPEDLRGGSLEAPPSTISAQSRLREGAYREAFRSPSHVDQLRSMEGNAIQNPWEFMKQTYKDSATARRSNPKMPFSPIHTATLAEQAITQTAIEKYKGEGAMEDAKRLQNISSTLHGNHRGGFESFDGAMDALMEEDIRGHEITDYFQAADERVGDNVSKSELETRARKAFRLQYNRNVSMQMLENSGIAGDTYKGFGSSMNVGDMDPAEKVAAGLGDRGQYMGESGGVQQMQSMMDFLQGDKTDRALQNFRSAENYFQSNIQSFMDRPASYREKFMNTLNDMPTGAKAAGLGGAVGLAGLALVDGPKTGGGGEQHDWPVERPQPDLQRGTRRTTASMLETSNKARIEQLYANMRERPVGQRHRMREPPAVRASY